MKTLWSRGKRERERERARVFFLIVLETIRETDSKNSIGMVHTSAHWCIKAVLHWSNLNIHKSEISRIIKCPIHILPISTLKYIENTFSRFNLFLYLY